MPELFDTAPDGFKTHRFPRLDRVVFLGTDDQRPATDNQRQGPDNR